MIALLFGAATHVLPAQVVGQVVDSEGAIIRKTTVRVMDADTRVPRQTATTDANGRFELRDLAVGRYLLAVSAPGFAEKLVPLETGNPAHRVSLRIAIAALGCDAPRMNCDTFGMAAPDLHPIRANGELKLEVPGTVDIEKGVIVQLPSTVADIEVVAQNGGVYLLPLNGARLGDLGETGGWECREKSLKAEPMRIDGRGEGTTICLRTRHGQPAEMFLIAEIAQNTKQIEVYFVTRTR
jgi:Carboxypeptidase regulatory-like domain